MENDLRSMRGEGVAEFGMCSVIRCLVVVNRAKLEFRNLVRSLRARSLRLWRRRTSIREPR